MTYKRAKGEKPHPVFNNYQGFSKFNRYFYLRLGRIVEVDYEKYQIKIQWVQGSGSPSWIPISFPYAGPAGCMGAMPEIGAIGIFGFYDEGQGKGAPFLVTYVPTGLNTGLNYNTLKLSPDQIPNEDKNIVPYRFRALQKGDIIVSSPLGSQLFLNTDAYLADERQDSIRIRGSDQSIISTSLNNYLFANGATVSAGPILRNSMLLFDEFGKRIPNINARETTLSDGRDAVYLVPLGDRIGPDTQYYSEYRIEADEIVNGILDSNDVNGYSVTDSRDPVVVLAMGNYANANLNNNRYGKFLRPVLFTSPDDQTGEFDLVQCLQNQGLDEVSKLGLDYALHFIRSGSFIGVDKEGHYHIHLTASNVNPLGGGRSMSVLAAGSLKEIWGATLDTANSWDLATKGGIRWNIGAHNVDGSGRSIDIKTTSGIKIEAGGEDADGFAKQEIVNGQAQTVVGGNETTNIFGSSTLKVDGLRTEKINGSASYQYQVDKSENVLGVYTQTVVKEMQGNFGKRKVSIAPLGNDELWLTAGNIMETILGFGNRLTTLLGAGNIIENIVAGNKVTLITAGSYNVVVTTGAINMATAAGTATLAGSASASLVSAAVANVTAPKVNLGLATGGVVTGLPGIPSTFCPITGLPPRGSMTVSAGP